MFNCSIHVNKIISFSTFVLGLGVLLVCPLNYAAPSALASPYKQSDLDLQREQFIIAENAVKSGRLKQYQRLKPALKDYPLYPYLKLAELRRQLNSTPVREIKKFLDDYQDTPLASKLYYSWIRSLARHGKYETLVENFYPEKNTGQLCRFAYALMNTKQSKQAYALMDKIWLNGSSLPDSCDRPIKTWKNAGFLSNDLLWARIKLVMAKRNHRLATFLGKELPAQQRTWLSLWKKAQRNPEFLIKKIERISFIKNHIFQSIMADGIKRLAYNEPLLVAKHWQKLNKKHSFNKNDKEKIERQLARALARMATPSSHEVLMKLNLNNYSAHVIESHIFSALQDNDSSTALTWLDKLNDEERNSERWLYWRARTLEGMQRNDEAKYLFQSISSNRSYYSFLASEKIGNTYKLTHKPLKSSKTELTKIKQIPAIARAHEFLKLKRKASARSEWNHAIKKMNTSQLLIAAQVAHQWDWKNRSITTLAKAKYWDEVVLRFPLSHRKHVEDLANKKGINPAWAFAVIRQESAFVTDAKSSSGALGLMQLMPRTARYMARKIGVKRPRKNDLINSDINIKLGVNYLNKLLNDFSGNTALATAAYNAGPSRVNSWLPSNDINTDLWVEMIPYHETRDYLKRVLTYTIIYERRLGLENSPLLEPVLSIPSKQTASLI